MGKNVKALKNLYVAVGGKASDVANATTSAEVISATADLQRAVVCPISIDLVVADEFENISVGNCNLIKNLPYIGTNASNTAWLDNFKTVCDTHVGDIGRFVKVGLVTGYKSTQQDMSKYVSHVIDLEPTTLVKTVNGEVTTYGLFGKCQFAGGATPHWATFEWEIKIAYNSSSDTFTETTFSGECTSYD